MLVIQVTDRALVFLKEISSFRLLDLSGTPILDAADVEVQRVLPHNGPVPAVFAWTDSSVVASNRHHYVTHR